MSQHDQHENEREDKHGDDGKNRQNPNNPKVREFLRKLDELHVRRRVAAGFKSIAEGDWEGLRRIAEAEGITVTAEELRQAMPASFYKGEGQNPSYFWRRS